MKGYLFEKGFPSFFPSKKSLKKVCAMDMGLIVLIIGGLIFLALLFSALFQYTRIPDVLPLVLIGIIIGPVLGWVKSEYLGKVGEVFTVATLIVILLDGGLTLSVSSLKRSMMFGVLLTVLNFITISFSTMLILHFLLGFPYLHGLIAGSILGGICSDVIVPMIEKLPIMEKTRAALLLESTFSDVLCIVVTLGLIEAVNYNELDVLKILSRIGLTFLIATAAGILAGFVWTPIIRHIRHFKNSTLATLAFAFLVYGIVEAFGYSGGITVLAYGITLNNIGTIHFGRKKYMRRMKVTKDCPEVLTGSEKSFLSEIVFLLKTLFYILIGISFRFNEYASILTAVLLTFISLQIRIPVVWLALDRTVKKKDAYLASIMVPRGLAAAVLSGIAIRAGLSYGEDIQNIIYSSIFISIIITAVMAFLIETGIIRQPYKAVFKNFGERWDEE
ncbi:MAG: cation:proton antiporter [Thermoplasmata archaeon]